MAIVEPGGSGDVPDIPNGLYEATILSNKSITLDQPDNFGNTEKIEVQVGFTVGDEECTLEPRVNRKWGEKATLFQIAVAAGLAPNPHEPFDTNDLNQRKVNILVETLEEGRWPRVTKWSAISTKKASSTSQRPTAAPSEDPPVGQPATVVNPDGTANLTAFWAQVKRLGLNRSHVIERVDGDIENLMKLDGPDVAYVLEELTAMVNAGEPHGKEG